jgi:hypothetical protein
MRSIRSTFKGSAYFWMRSYSIIGPADRLLSRTCCSISVQRMRGSLGRWVRWLSAPFLVADSPAFIGPPLQIAEACARRWSEYLIGTSIKSSLDTAQLLRTTGRKSFGRRFDGSCSDCSELEKLKFIHVRASRYFSYEEARSWRQKIRQNSPAAVASEAIDDRVQ